MAGRVATRLYASLVSSIILLAFGWILVYEYSFKPLKMYGGLKFETVKTLEVAGLEWWKDFIALAFDVLIIVVALVGSWWVIANIITEAREAVRWKTLRGKEPEVRRFTLWQIIQHWWMALTFLVCVITGFAAYYDVLAPRQTLITLHVYSGLAMGVLVVIHFTQYTVEALAAKARGESLREKYPMLEIYSMNFLRNLWRALIKPFKPEVKVGPYGKYNPEQLFEYWGVYWGIAILGIPGLIMLLYGPETLQGILWIMHFKEAILATAFIVMVHIAYTHLRPSVFPVDKVIFTGRMPLSRAKHEHPAWKIDAAEESIAS
ncbi:MAG: hypothetical protein F7C32_01040 [Desulfurococcales archaeon]|nr:hypothetical protein [Desulfurococcales archaeon]